MPDREKVIKDLEECMTASCRGYRPRLSCPYNDEEWDIMRDALALLKEQDAVEARKKHDGKPQPWSSWWYVCGDCGQEIEYHDRFCRWCGRSVKWDA